MGNPTSNPGYGWNGNYEMDKVHLDSRLYIVF